MPCELDHALLWRDCWTPLASKVLSYANSKCIWAAGQRILDMWVYHHCFDRRLLSTHTYVKEDGPSPLSRTGCGLGGWLGSWACRRRLAFLDRLQFDTKFLLIETLWIQSELSPAPHPSSSLPLEQLHFDIVEISVCLIACFRISRCYGRTVSEEDPKYAGPTEYE